MPRKERVEFAGAIYHVMDRGDRLEAIYRDDRDREIFCKTLAEASGRAGWRVHSYVLMDNHYHLLLETPEANLSAGMHWMQATYTIRHNARHRLRGHLFQGRYKANLVDGDSDGYFLTASDYIHLNPVRAGLIADDQGLESFRWSSYPALIGDPEKRPAWLEGGRILSGFGSRDDETGRRLYREAMERRVGDERMGGSLDVEDLKAIRQGWCFGSEEFRQKILDDFGDRGAEVRKSRSPVQVSHDAREAARLVEWGLGILGVAEETLPRLAKSDARKIALASLVKSRTLVSNQWLADRLCMGVASRVSAYCGQAEGREDVAGYRELLDDGVM